MALPNLAQIIMIFTFLLAAIAILKTMLLIRENKLLSTQLTKTAVRLEKTEQLFNKLRQQHKEVQQFRQELKQAELTTKIHQSKLVTEQASEATFARSAIHEKYSYVRSLAEKGLEPPEIATILSISTHEAKQLFSLASLGKTAEV